MEDQATFPHEIDQSEQEQQRQIAEHNENDGSLAQVQPGSTTATGVQVPAAAADVIMDEIATGAYEGGGGSAADVHIAMGSTPDNVAGVDSSTTPHADASGNVDQSHGDDATGPAVKRQRLDEAGTSNGIEESAAGASLSAAEAIAQQNKKVHTEQWNEMLERLKAYKAQYGDTLVPKRFAQDPRLGTWVETQRVQYKRLPRIHDESVGHEVPQPNKRLTAERLQKLSDLGFCWSAKHIRKTGSTGSLGSAAGAAKTATPSSPAVNDTMMVTEEPTAETFVPTTVTVTMPGPAAAPAPAPRPPAPIATNPAATIAKAAAAVANADAQWDDFYERLARFQQIHGHTLVPRKYEADPKLGAWVETQRVLWNRDYNQGKDKSPWPVDPATAVAITKRLSLERKEKLDALGFVWSLRSKRIDDHWDEMFKQLVDYKNEHGDCLVPSRYEANLKLGKWVETQRYEYTKLQRSAYSSDNDEAVVAAPPGSNSGLRPTNPRLTPERLRRLESIGFEWKVKNKMKRYYDKQWDGMFQKLLEFKAQYGHVNVPKRYPENMKLGTWVHTQRIQYRKLTTGNVKETVKDGKPDGGDAAKSEDSPGASDPNASPPYSFHEEGEDMGANGTNWTAEQAQSYRLTDARRQRLEEVGFCWSAREGNEKATLETAGRITRNSYDDQWDAMFDMLAKYKEEHGHTNVPKRFQANPKLGTWVDTQRVQYKKLQKKIAQLQHQKQMEASGQMAVDDNASVGSTGSTTGTPLVGRLTQERINRLQGLGFVWSLRDDWAKHYEELKAYRAIHGHCNVPARYQENRRLGIWVSAQRQQYKILQQQKLAPGTLNQNSAAAAAVALLMDNETGSADGSPPVDGANNATASNNDAKARRSAPLTQERIDLLNAIGFTWTIRSRDSMGESWNQRLLELRQFKQQYGHCLVPSRYEANPELGIWVGTQRTQYRLFMRSKETGVPVSTSMNKDRIRDLEELGFVWALRTTLPDETVAAAEAAAAAVEIADQMAGVAAAHDPTAYHHHAQHLDDHNPFELSHQSHVHEAPGHPTEGGNTDVSNHNNGAGSHNDYGIAI